MFHWLGILDLHFLKYIFLVNEENCLNVLVDVKNLYGDLPK